MRLIERLMMQVEHILVANELQVVTKESVETARENLVIGLGLFLRKRGLCRRGWRRAHQLVSVCPNRSRAGRAIMQNLPTGTVTLLFTDIAESTRLLHQLGDRYAGVLAECRQILRTAFGQWNGNVVDTQGDAFFVVFARATDAMSAAVAAQRALPSHTFPEDVAAAAG